MLILAGTPYGALTEKQTEKISFLHVPPVKWKDIIEARFYSEPAIARLYVLPDGTWVPVCTCEKFIRFPFKKKEVASLRRKPGINCVHTLSLLLYFLFESFKKREKKNDKGRSFKYKYLHLESLSPRLVFTEKDIVRSAGKENLKEFIRTRSAELAKGDENELETRTMLPNTKKIRKYVEELLVFLNLMEDKFVKGFMERGAPVQLFFWLETKRFHYCAKRFEKLPSKNYYFRIFHKKKLLTTWKLGSYGVFSALENIKRKLFLHFNRGIPFTLELEFAVPGSFLKEEKKLLIHEAVRTFFPYAVHFSDSSFPETGNDALSEAQDLEEGVRIPFCFNFKEVRDLKVAVSDFVHFVLFAFRYIHSVVEGIYTVERIIKKLSRFKDGMGELLKKERTEESFLSLVIALQDMVPESEITGSQFFLKCRKYTPIESWPCYHYVAKRLLFTRETNLPREMRGRAMPNIIIDI